MKPSRGSEWSLLAALADPGTGTQALATGRPLEEWSDWPVIGSLQNPRLREGRVRAHVPVGVWPSLETSRPWVVKGPRSSEWGLAESRDGAITRDRAAAAHPRELA